MHFAAQKGFSEMANLLLANNANANISNINKIMPLHFTAFYGHEEIVSSLIQREAILDAKSNVRKTLLNYAAKVRHSSIVKFLLTAIEDKEDIKNKVNNNLTVLNYTSTKVSIDKQDRTTVAYYLICAVLNLLNIVIYFICKLYHKTHLYL